MSRFWIVGVLSLAISMPALSLRADGGGLASFPCDNVANLALLQKRIDEIVSKLDADSWSEREASEKALVGKLDACLIAIPYVVRLLKRSKNPEVKFRLGNALRTYYRNRLISSKGKRGFLGLQLSSVSMNPRGGIFIVGVERGLPGEKAGLLNGDVIVSTDGKVLCLDDFIAYIALCRPGARVRLELARNGVLVEKSVVLAVRPKDLPDPVDDSDFERFFKMWLRDVVASPPFFTCGGWKVDVWGT